jgi:hypothetical protein
MISAHDVIDRIEAAGGVLTLQGDRIRCRLPEDACLLLDELRARRDEVFELLRQRADIPTMPKGVRLLLWKLKDPPLSLENFAVVTNPAVFVRATIEQLRVAVNNPKRWVGWSPAQLVERLAQAGVLVALDAEVEVR